jgi:hypothetical protein
MIGLLVGAATPQAPLLPPRPNLGPEPWPSAWATYGPYLTIALAVFWIGLTAWRVYGRGAGSRGRRIVGRGPSREAEGAQESLVVWSGRVREALATRVDGREWGARTTEEIAEDPLVTAALGAEGALALVRFLRVADRAKFGTSATEAGPDEVRGLADWASAFVAGKDVERPAAGARSMMSGR